MISVTEIAKGLDLWGKTAGHAHIQDPREAGGKAEVTVVLICDLFE